MDINKKIEEIRKKPEHIRMRYVWGGVAIVMILIFIIWLFSLQETFKSTKKETESFTDLREKIEDQKKSMPSLENLLQNDNKSTSSQEGVSQNNDKPADVNNGDTVLNEDSEPPAQRNDDKNTNSDISDEPANVDDGAVYDE
jgi:uncharacterized membrane protein YvbJ